MRFWEGLSKTSAGLDMKRFSFAMLLLVAMARCFAIDGILVQTIDYSIREKWACTPAASMPMIPNSDTVFRGQTIYLSAIVGDYRLDTKGCADVVLSVEVFRPDGSEYYSVKEQPFMDGYAGYMDGRFQMSSTFLSVTFENKDPLGSYGIKMLITDRVSHTSKMLESKVELVELPAYDHFTFTDEERLMDWVNNYHRCPQPEKALAAYLYICPKYGDDETALIPLLGLMLEIFQHNQFLYPQLSECYDKQSEDIQNYLDLLMYYLGIGREDFTQSVGEEVQLILDLLQETLYPEKSGVIVTPIQLDVLWGKFLASGSYEPVLKLIKTLDYVKYRGSMKKVNWKNWYHVSDQKKQEALNEMIYEALRWSLHSNCKQFPLVRQYCEWALSDGNLTGTQRRELQKVLSAKNIAKPSVF